MFEISVVIPNARPFPKVLVRQLISQLNKGDEILIVKNQPLSKKVWIGIGIDQDMYSVRYIQNTSSVSIRTLNSKSGASLARNLGWQEAENSWILFLDDDIEIGESFIAEIRSIVKNKEADMVNTFRTITDFPETLLPYAKMITLDRGPMIKKSKPMGGIPLNLTWMYGNGSAMLVHKSILIETMGFKKCLSAGIPNGGAEDLEFLWHASYHTTIKYHGSINIRHQTLEEVQSILWKVVQYGRALALLGGKSKSKSGFLMVIQYCLHIVKHSLHLPRNHLFTKSLFIIIYALIDTLRVWFISLIFSRFTLLCPKCYDSK